MALTLTFAGRTRFFALHTVGADRLTVAVECRFGDLLPMHALLDTGSQWSVLPPEVARQLGYPTDPDPDVPRYWTRFGLLSGRMERAEVTIPTDEGQEAKIEATFYIPEIWNRPPVIGWCLCLELMPFALDPRQYEEYLYFGTGTKG